MQQRIEYVSELADRVARDTTLQDQIKADPAAAIASLAGPVYTTDKWIYRMVVFALGLVAVAAIGGTIYLTAAAKPPIPEVLTALGSAAVGALAGLLAPTPVGKS